MAFTFRIFPEEMLRYFEIARLGANDDDVWGRAFMTRMRLLIGQSCELLRAKARELYNSTQLLNPRQTLVHNDEHASRIRTAETDALLAEARRRIDSVKEREDAVQVRENAIEEREVDAATKLAEALNLAVQQQQQLSPTGPRVRSPHTG